jgi:hypothetical protein
MVASGGAEATLEVVDRELGDEHEADDHPSAILPDMNAPDLPVAVEIVGGVRSRTLVSVFPPKIQ